MRTASQNGSVCNNEGTTTFFQTDNLNCLSHNSCEKAQNKPGNLISKRPPFYVQVLKDLRFFHSAPYISLRFLLQLGSTVVKAPSAVAVRQRPNIAVDDICPYSAQTMWTEIRKMYERFWCCMTFYF